MNRDSFYVITRELTNALNRGDHAGFRNLLAEVSPVDAVKAVLDLHGWTKDELRAALTVEVTQ
jgi:hypothetical protein